MEDSSDESIAMVEDYMKQARELVAGWEADFGKEQMTQERGYINFTWSGDAVWAIEEGAEVGVDLRYVVPTEGSTVWFDGWVIPKYAVNVKAATYFIDFMCRPDIAIRNMEETGYVSANGDISVMESQIDDSYDPVDLSYFFGEDATEVCVNPVLYPDKSVMDLCVLEHDWGEKTEKLIAMWSRVKGSDTNAMTVIVISVFLIGMLALGLYNKFFSKKAKRRRAARRRARNK
jgi:spermidine/putrescine transport system substrate-binding protein